MDRKNSVSNTHFPELSSPVETEFLSTPADLSSSASDKSFITKPKVVLDAENSNSQTIPKPLSDPAKIAPAKVAEVKHRTEENRIVL
jgi:hypothetical protein